MSSITEQTSTYIPLSQRSVWSDVIPIPQDDGPNPLVPIMYSAEYRDAMDYFRALSATGERSERGLELTETIIRMNPAHYTIWQFRMATILALEKDLTAELQLMNEFAKENLKSYQVWHHRLLLMDAISPNDPGFEIDYIHDSLLPDPKNYHTWAYLHWLYSRFSSLGRITAERWRAEDQWCDEMLRTDGRNNSAWGWRWYLRVARPDAPGLQDDGDGEVKYAIAAIHLIPHNVSAWNYLRGLLHHFKRPLSLFDLEAYTSEAPVPYALELKADTLLEQHKDEDAAAVFSQLGTVDKMRAGYWEHRRRECVE